MPGKRGRPRRGRREEADPDPWPRKVPAAHRRRPTPLPASWTIPAGSGFKSDGGTCGRSRHRERAHRRESRLSRMRSRSSGRATGVVIVRVPHRNTPTSGERTPQLLTRPVEQVPGVREPLSRPDLLWAWGRATAAGHFPRLTQASFAHFTYRRPLRVAQIEGRPLRATIRNATLHRISLTIVNGQPGAADSGPRGTRMVRSNPQPERVGPARGASADSPAGLGIGCRSVLLGQLRDDGGVRGIDRLAHLVVRDRATDAQRVPSRSAYVRHHARVPRVAR